MSISISKFMGGADDQSITGTEPVRRDVRWMRCESISVGEKVQLPDPANDTDYPLGGPYWYLHNTDAADTLDVVDKDAVVVGSIPPQSVAAVVLGAGAAGKQWFVILTAGEFAGRTRYKS